MSRANALALTAGVARSVRLRVGSNGIRIGQKRAEITVDMLFDDLPMPDIGQAWMDVLRGCPAAAQWLSCVQPVLLIGAKDGVEGYTVVSGLEMLTLARRLAAVAGQVTIQGFVLELEVSTSSDGLATRLLAWRTGLTGAGGRGRVAALVWSRLGREPGARISRAAVGDLVGVSRQAVGGPRVDAGDLRP